jgi:hypothetical protein
MVTLARNNKVGIPYEALANKQECVRFIEQFTRLAATPTGSNSSGVSSSSSSYQQQPTSTNTTNLSSLSSLSAHRDQVNDVKSSSSDHSFDKSSSSSSSSYATTTTSILISDDCADNDGGIPMDRQDDEHDGTTKLPF